MQINFTHHAEINESLLLSFAQHVLLILLDDLPAEMPFQSALEQKLKRSQRKLSELGDKPVTLELANGTLVSLVQLNSKQSAFEQQTQLRKAVQPLLEERPTQLAIGVYGTSAKEQVARLAAYVTAINAQNLPALKREVQPAQLKEIRLFGVDQLLWADEINAAVAGNTLCRTLTLTPPNQQTPLLYRQRLQVLANEQAWQYTEWDVQQLKSLGVGAFVAVAQGSEPQDAAIVKLTYRHPQATKTIALVGKGICFDTGGHNLKSAKYMQGMHQDMNGSAVAVGTLQAIGAQQLL